MQAPVSGFTRTCGAQPARRTAPPGAAAAPAAPLGSPTRARSKTSTCRATYQFCFRFNRRRSPSRGLVFYRVLELAIGHDPVRYWHLVADPKPKKKPPEAPGQRGHPPSIERPRAARPWRTVHLG